MIKYLGSKRLLLPAILEAVGGFAPRASRADRAGSGDTRTVLDLFSGTSRVGHALKRAGYRVIASDHNAYAATLARCYVQADREDVLADAERLIAELSRLPGRPGYFTDTFCVKSRFFQPKNGERVDAIRDAIAAKSLAPELEAVLLVSLMEAADRVDSTTGVQMAYLKQWAARAHNELQLRVPDVLPRALHGKGRAIEGDALEVAAEVDADVAYLDPPYNQHKYLGNYHVWETLVRWDRPEVYGVACKRLDTKERTSDFNSRVRFEQTFAELVRRVRARHLVVSFNDEGFLGPERAVEILSSRGPVRVIEHDYKRYVGAQIGIFNPKGQRVGEVSHLRNRELLYVVG
ncbi:MAG: DNA adenine methylase [Sandaracinaceae bacterium]|nr:DNA adenine methylase [Sandaracinaceae bacterium]